MYRGMWREAYLETCCRSALHRVELAGDIARPGGMKDGPCLERLHALGLVIQRPDKRYVITGAGAGVHATQIMHIPRQTCISD